MMSIRLLQTWGGYAAGTVLNPAAPLARKLIEEQIALEIISAPEPEAMTVAPAESAVRPRPRSRRTRKQEQAHGT